ncbi:peptide chain release factor H [Affinibrenneria salicis]|uniref:Peptide chain release factor H n=1 Tax=Affinibrenneria salicis TaxID=2590031 RepID=A0A5J5FW18_9GAMM|nr:peptide chain release factor H [Affinibrenneria salicis]KAA8997731.1 peptide chain release factor H [Affinibrenneria salicis]
MILIQLSAAQGPDECMLATAKALRRLMQEAKAINVELELVESEDGDRPGTLRSALVLLRGEQAETLADNWCGTLQWTCASPWRKGPGRKNWFIGVTRFTPQQTFSDGEIRFTTLKASGPGGQHVNKTESAVRATHVASGISVKVQSERSQHANRRLAAYLIAWQLQNRRQQREAQLRAQRRQFHHEVERGNPIRVFRGEGFEPA